MLQSPELSFLIDYLWIISFLLIPAGLLMLLYGYKLFKLFIGFIGFLAGSVLGFLLSFATGDPMLTSLLCGFIGAFLFYILYKAGLFLTGFALGGIISLVVASGLSGDVAIASFIAGGFIGGVVALQLEKLIVIVLSSYQGSAMVLGGAALVVFPEQQARLIETLNSNPQALISLVINYLLLLLIVSMFGIMYQYKLIPNLIDGYLPNFLKTSLFKKEESEQHGKSTQTDRPAKNRQVNTEAYSRKEDGENWESSIFPNENLNSKFSGSVSESDDLEISWEENTPARSNIISEESQPVEHKKSTYYNVESNDLKRSSISENNRVAKKKTGVFELAVRPYVQFYKYLSGSLYSRKKEETKFYPVVALIKSGSQRGQQFKIRGLFNGKYYSATLGRGGGNRLNHVKLSDPSKHLSRIHAEIVLKGEELYIRNISHANPLYLNGAEIENSVFSKLQDGDMIRLGDIEIKAISTM